MAAVTLHLGTLFRPSSECIPLVVCAWSWCASVSALARCARTVWVSSSGCLVAVSIQRAM
eukprot:9923839-Alexandrium_andersonii.AAC.1